ncbi:MAG TPA: hypothetical protein VFE84_05615, partial [Patescibacteria group bacterium]|nr:hypothetical protein [Patescibacteria group bacterium]
MTARSRFASSLTIGCLAVALCLSTALSTAQQGETLTVGRVLELLQQGTPPDTLVTRLRAEEGSFDLTIEDIVRLSAAGAPAELIRLMARGDAAPEQVDERPLAPVAEPGPDALTLARVVKLFHKEVPLD